jgi:hypothetical protein
MPTTALFSDPVAFVDFAYRLTDSWRIMAGPLLMIALVCEWYPDPLSMGRPLTEMTVYDRYHQHTVKYRWVKCGNRLGAPPSDRSERTFPSCMLE